MDADGLHEEIHNLPEILRRVDPTGFESRAMPERRKEALLIATSNSYGRELLPGIRVWMREHDSWSVRFVKQSRGAAVPDWLPSWQGDGIVVRIENRQIENAMRKVPLPIIDVSAALARPLFPPIVTDSAEATRLSFSEDREIRHPPAGGFSDNPAHRRDELLLKRRAQPRQRGVGTIPKSCSFRRRPLQWTRR